MREKDESEHKPIPKDAHLHHPLSPKPEIQKKSLAEQVMARVLGIEPDHYPETVGKKNEQHSTERKPGYLKDGTPLKVHADKMAKKLVKNLNKNVR